MIKQEDSAELRTVRVADITEFPTDLGYGCLLLRERGLDPHWHTEEELLEDLIESAKQPECLNICTKSSRCNTFYDKFQQGITPFIDRDPIRLLEYGGRYSVCEGRRRVCLAKRSGVETLEAYIWQLDEDRFSLLPPEGMPTHFNFLSEYPTGNCRKATGDAAALWVKIPPRYPSTEFDFAPVALGAHSNTHGEWRTVLPGLIYRVSVINTIRWMKWRTHVLVDVVIDENHPKTKIWLIKGEARDIFAKRPLNTFSTLYRYGCWRNHHMKRLRRGCLHIM